MAIVKKNKKNVLNPSGRLGGIADGVEPNDAVNKSQLDAVSEGDIDLTRVEFGADGTAAAPALSWNGDTDTGLYRIGANNIGVAANGAKVLDIATTGLGITGTATVSSTTESSSKDTGSIITEGGVGIEKALYVGLNIDVGTTSNLQGAVTFGAGNIYKSLTTQTALAGGAQAGTALSAEYMDFTVVATALDSAQLPTGSLGARRIVKNSAALPMAVFGQTGASIDSGAANASVVVAPGQTVIFTAISSTVWRSNIGRLDIATGVITEQVTLTATEIVGNSAGDIGHANGATLVAGVSSAYAMEFVSATLIYDFDTAAYTGGADDLVVCISAGGATLSGATSSANLLGAAGDKIVVVYPLTTAGNPVSVGTGLSLKSTAWTQPGTAAGVLRCQVSYRLHKTGL